MGFSVGVGICGECSLFGRSERGEVGSVEAGGERGESAPWPEVREVLDKEAGNIDEVEAAGFEAGVAEAAGAAVEGLEVIGPLMG